MKESRENKNHDNIRLLLIQMNQAKTNTTEKNAKSYLFQFGTSFMNIIHVALQ